MFIGNCFHVIHTNNFYYHPYFRDLADFSRCDNQGQIKSGVHLYRINNESDDQSVDDCGESLNCVPVCEASFSIFYPSEEAEGDPDF